MLKGKGRPINKWSKRARSLRESKMVDFVFPLPKGLEKKEKQGLLISKIKPEILAVSSHTPNLDRKKEIVGKYGGQLKIVLLHDSRVSTTKILEKPIATVEPRKNGKKNG